MLKAIPVFAPLLLCGAVLTHASHRALDHTDVPMPETLHETLPSVEALTFMSLGYRSLVADYYWLRAINHFGDRRLHAALYPNLEPLVRRVLALDPYFAAAYFFAGTALTLEGMDTQRAIELLQRGMAYRPDVWQIPFFLGFNAYYFHGDYSTAARAMAKAAELPGSPPYTGPLAMRIAAEAGEPEIGLRLVDSLLNEIRDEKLVSLYKKRRELLRLEQHLKWLNQAVRVFAERHKRNPKDLSELVHEGILRGIPDDPLGGSFFIDAQGTVQTTSEKKRLRLNPLAKGNHR